MKVIKLNKLLIINSLLLSSFLTGCASQILEIDIPLTKEEIYVNKVVIAQICIPKFNYNNDYISGNIITLKNDWGTYTAKLQGITQDYEYIFQANLGNPLRINYYTVMSNESENNFAYKRDFTQYQVDVWSQWENPDFVFSGNEIPSLSMQTKIKLSASPIIMPTITETPRVRFKLMRFNEYIEEITINDFLISKKNMDNCE